MSIAFLIIALDKHASKIGEAAFEYCQAGAAQQVKVKVEVVE